MQKRLYRVDEGKKLCGVCAGLAEYFDLDPTLVRVGWIVLSMLAGSGLLAYIVAAIVMPRKTDII